MSEKREVSNFERRILERINYADRLLSIKLKFINDGTLSPLFKKSDILRIFGELGYKPDYLQGGGYVIYKTHKNYTFNLNCVNSRNVFDFFLNIFVDDKLVEGRESSMRAILRHIPYNKELANEGNSGKYGLNNLDDLKIYLSDMIGLIFEFVDEYNKEIEAGNIPE